MPPGGRVSARVEALDAEAQECPAHGPRLDGIGLDPLLDAREELHAGAAPGESDRRLEAAARCVGRLERCRSIVRDNAAARPPPPRPATGAGDIARRRSALRHSRRRRWPSPSRPRAHLPVARRPRTGVRDLHAHHVPRDAEVLGPVAQVPRRMVEDARHLGLAAASAPRVRWRSCPGWIEGLELVADDGLVVERTLTRPRPVPTTSRSPPKSMSQLEAAGRRRSAASIWNWTLKLVRNPPVIGSRREEAGRLGARRGRRQARTTSIPQRAAAARRRDIRAVRPAPSSAARRRSRSCSVFRISGSRWNTADDFSQSRLSIAG